MKFAKLLPLIALAGGLIFTGIHSLQEQSSQNSDSVIGSKETPTSSNDANSPFGFPSTGGTANDYIIQNPYFTLSYNSSKGGPNWVAWKLVASDSGDAERVPFFAADLPRGLNVVYPDDYTGSGFDRGHQCNHEDRSATPEASKATFVMTNMLPQAPDLNRKTWVALENYSRKLAKRGLTLYIVCGGTGTGGIGSNGPANTLKGKVNVPATCWKVILITDGTSTPNANWELIVVNMPNTQDLDLNWNTYRVPLATVENATGLKFFPALGSQLDQIKSKE